MRFAPLIVSAALGIIPAGCTVGPDYARPSVKVPAQWGGSSVRDESQAAPSLAAWWRTFNDPELDALIDAAIESNLDLRIAEARVRQARALYGFTAADRWPAIGASGSYARQQQSRNQPIIGSLPLPPGVSFENSVYQAGFDATWEIDVFGGTRRAVEAGASDLAAMEYGRHDVLVTLLSDVARNYVLLRGAQNELAIARGQIRTQEEAVAITQSRVEHGAATELDLQRAVALLSTLESQVPTIETSIQIPIHRLGVLVAQSPGALRERLSIPASLPATSPTVPVGLPSDLLQRRPDIRSAERRLASATARIGQAKADLFPRFSLTGAAGFTSVNTSDFFSPDSRLWSIGPSVQWRIFDAGRVRAGIRARTAVRDQARLSYEQVILTALEDVENALVAYAKERERGRLLRRAVAANQKAVELASQLVDRGLGNYLVLLDARRALYTAQQDLARSERAVTVNLIALYKALGGGWEPVG